eukprot:TRINITY_DN2587_c0_g1_i1.p1 TRINITY_DN2587_c0_g1~~TRINITY_DN2587_c0_g1_i1.p1  ORF type:complete len:469 (-),score=182.12 TRINITY_DN2587_c0_g1_i1:965-2371(-)
MRFFREGEEVLQLWDDGLFYYGIIVESDPSGCLVRFGDRREKWSPLSRLKRLEGQEEEDSEGESSSVSEERNSPLRKKKKHHSDSENQKAASESNNSIGDEVEEAETLVPSRVLEARKELSYDFSSLTWDAQHLRNTQEKYCYCGESGDWYRRMLQCEKCAQWFHQECIRAHTSLLFGDRFWVFICTLCTGTSEEIVQRRGLTWRDALQLSLFNLTLINNKKFHDLETSILPFIRSKWKALHSGQAGTLLSKTKLNSTFISSLLKSNRDRFKSGSEKRSSYWGLRRLLPPTAPHQPEISTLEPHIKHTPTNQSRRGGVKAPPAMKFGSSNNSTDHHPSSSKRRGRSQASRPPIGSLDSFIPIPKNFEGPNNPFRSSCNSSSNNSSSCSSPNPFSSEEKEEPSSYFKEQDEILKSSLDSLSPHHHLKEHHTCNRVLARRLTASGEIQYLIDKQNQTWASSLNVTKSSLK